MKNHLLVTQLTYTGYKSGMFILCATMITQTVDNFTATIVLQNRYTNSLNRSMKAAVPSSLLQSPETRRFALPTPLSHFIDLEVKTDSLSWRASPLDQKVQTLKKKHKSSIMKSDS